MADKLFQEFVEDLRSDFTIDGYTNLRKKFPDKNPALQLFVGEGDTFMFSGIEVAFQYENEFKNFGITVEYYLGTLDGVESEIDNLCMEILMAISERRKAVNQKAYVVADGIVIGDAFIDFLIGVIIESISSYELAVPNSYQVLLKVRLGLYDGKIKKEIALQGKKNYIAHFIALNPNFSMREVAKIMNVNVSTISRWHQEPHFQWFIEMVKSNERGDLFPPPSIPKD